MSTLEKVVGYAGKRIKNLADMVTSKKVLVGALAVAAILSVTSLAKIIAIGSIGLGYVIIQGIIDTKAAGFEDQSYHIDGSMPVGV